MSMIKNARPWPTLPKTACWLDANLTKTVRYAVNITNLFSSKVKIYNTFVFVRAL